MIALEQVRHRIAPLGLSLRGGFHPEPEDGVPALADGTSVATLLLVGHVGGEMWPVFSRASEHNDGAPHALDRWTRRVLGEAAASLGATAFYPFGGPPWLPFQRWAQRGDGVAVSPLGILIHPDYGLWHAYRGALAFARRLELPDPVRASSPCLTCRGRPCLSTCPVGAFSATGYDVAGCRRHVGSPAGGLCREGGCAARLACPVGRQHAYPPAQMAFHMAAFLAGR